MKTTNSNCPIIKSIRWIKRKRRASVEKRCRLFTKKGLLRGEGERGGTCAVLFEECEILRKKRTGSKLYAAQFSW